MAFLCIFRIMEPFNQQLLLLQQVVWETLVNKSQKSFLMKVAFGMREER